MPQRAHLCPERFDRVCSIALTFNDGNLFRRQVIEFIDQIVDLAVERGAPRGTSPRVSKGSRSEPVNHCQSETLLARFTAASTSFSISVRVIPKGSSAFA